MPKEAQIRVLYVQPGKYPEERVIEHTLAAMQTLVGGDIEAVYPWDNAGVVCDGEGKLKQKPLNRLLEDYDVLSGSFFVCGLGEDDFTSLTDKQFRYYEKLFRDPELFLPTPIGIMPMKCTPDQYKRLMQERNAANREER